MKKLFQAIRKSEIEAVKQLIQKKPELVNCVAKQPPKKDDGQSPLQVALKTGNSEIAEYLIEAGADVNFIEDTSCCNSWRTPVLHDAINNAVMKSRWNVNSEHMGFKVYSTEEDAERAYAILEKMLDLGADVNAVDSFGNSAIWRFCLQASQILPAYDYINHCVRDDRIFTDELSEDLSRILDLLCKNGADLSYATPSTKAGVSEFYKEGPVHELLTMGR